jgi:hypothetical protein
MDDQHYDSAPVPLETLDDLRGGVHALQDDNVHIRKTLHGQANTMLQLKLRQDALDRGQVEILHRLDENTVTTQKAAAAAAEIVEVVQMFRSLGKLVEWIGDRARPIGYIAFAVSSAIGLYAAIKALP